MDRAPFISIADTVRRAVAGGSPVVALESAVITHGLPRPDNLASARSMEAIVRETGAEPATIAVIDGKLKVGLNSEELEWLALKATAGKASLRDLGPMLAKGGTGGTTVAATLHAAHQAGLRVFATGGIGGVHLGHPEDVSADLQALSRLPLAVVCAGAKSVLDLPRTLEHLETLGVPVIGVGTNDLPAFYVERSGLPLTAQVATPQEAAEVAVATWESGLHSACVFAIPLPPAAALDPQVLERATEQAQAEAERTGVSGRDLTPFLLSRVGELTDGASLRANRALLEQNARFAGELAGALAAAGHESAV